MYKVGGLLCDSFEYQISLLNDHRSLMFLSHHVFLKEQKCLVDQVFKIFSLFFLVMLFWSYVKNLFLN